MAAVIDDAFSSWRQVVEVLESNPVMGRLVALVIAITYPAQIGRVIISWISINVISLWETQWVWYERLSYEAMHLHHTFINTCNHIPRVVCGQLFYYTILLTFSIVRDCVAGMVRNR